MLLDPSRGQISNITRGIQGDQSPINKVVGSPGPQPSSTEGSLRSPAQSFASSRFGLSDGTWQDAHSNFGSRAQSRKTSVASSARGSSRFGSAHSDTFFSAEGSVSGDERSEFQVGEEHQEEQGTPGEASEKPPGGAAWEKF